MKFLVAVALCALTLENAVAFLPAARLPLRTQTRAASCASVQMNAERPVPNIPPGLSRIWTLHLCTTPPTSR
eukprot:3017905-Rhodomonas_salina.1